MTKGGRIAKQIVEPHRHPRRFDHSPAFRAARGRKDEGVSLPPRLTPLFGSPESLAWRETIDDAEGIELNARSTRPRR